MEQFKLEFKIKYEKYDGRINQYRRNKTSAAALLWKQWSSGMRAKLQARTDFEQIEKDPIELLKAIQEHSMNYESSQYKMKIIIDAVKNFVNTRQRHGESLTDYLGRFKATKDVFLSHVRKDFGKLIKEDTMYAEIKSHTSLTDEQVKQGVEKVAQ